MRKAIATILLISLWSVCWGQDDVPVTTVEYQALVDFYNGTNGDNWLNKWDINVNDINTGNWYGVTSENGHITGIDLQRNRVRGAIPASFGNLKYLKTLNLYGYSNSNDFSTTDLNNLSGLESLESLNLGYCKLTGSTPSSWGKLTKLKNLLLNNNTLEGPLFEEIGELISLETINIGNNQFTSIPSTISNLINVTRFDAYGNKISGSLIKAFEDLVALTRLRIYSNELTDIDAFLSTSVSLSLTSQRITLDSLAYNGEDVVFDSLPRIVKYDRSKNDFSYLPTFRVYLRGGNQGNIVMAADGSLTIPKSYLASMGPEDDLYIQQIGGALNSTIIRFSSVTVDLPAVPDEEYQALVDFYNATNGPSWGNKWVTETNNLNEGAWFGLSIENGHITGIDLQRNRVRGAIPASFGNLKYLKTLNLYGYSNSNDFSTTDLNNLSGLESLEYLNLAYCKLLGNIPASWGKLTKLKTLILNNNSLEGPIFEEIGELTSLETFNVSVNQLTSIPSTISSLVNLTTFDAYNNKISGPLIKSFEDLTALTRLRIYSNELTDIEAFLKTSISLSISSQRITLDSLAYKGEDVVFDSLPRIVKYDRSKNDFSYLPTFRVYLRGSNQGNIVMAADGSLTIPNTFLASIGPEDDFYLQQTAGALSSTNIRFTTTTIDLPAIPDEEYQALVDFYDATTGTSWRNKWPTESNTINEGSWFGITIEDGHISEINLRSNRLNGAIPASFGDLKFLKKLDLYNNNLSTTDLNNLSGLESLEYIDLTYCQLTGSIPASWGELTNLKTVILNNNTLEGPLFEEIGALISLETISIGSNRFTSVPSTISSLVNLTTFDAYDNKISGSLIKSFEDLTALTRLRIYSNELTDIEAFLKTSISLGVTSQRITLDSLTYKGEDVVFDSLPRIVKYDRNKNDFSYVPTFLVYLRGSYLGNIVMAADGSLTIPKSYLASIGPVDDLYLQQTGGALNGTTIRFASIKLDLPAIPDEEYQALVDFYDATNGTSWRNKWETDSNTLNEGSWFGVSIEEGHITEINLRSNRLTGAVPASFGDLKFLKKLDLYNNDLNTTDLNNLSGLESLEYLDLGYCQLTESIPASWSKLTNLKTLVINNNAIENMEGSFSALKPESLNFNSQNLTFDSVEVGADKIFIELPRYMTLNLVAGNITFDAKNEFRLYVNNVNQRTTFSNNGQLIFSNLSQLNLKETDKVRIYQVDGIARYSNLNYNAVSFGLPLVDEEFEILKKIYEATSGANWTNTWDISINDVNKVSWYGVAVQNGHIVGLDLFNNQLSGTIPPEITGLTFLKTLNLSNNNLSGALPINLETLYDLEILDVNSNQLSGTITPKISELLKLKKLAIGDNQFEGAIPTAFSDFNALEFLDISSNGFDKLDKKLYYDFSTTYIDLRNQKIQYDIILSLNDGKLKVTVSDIVKYDLVNNDYEAKNNFSLLVNNLTQDTTTLNDSGEIIFENIDINAIPIDASIAVRQTSGSFLNTEFTFAGIEDKSNVQVVEEEYSSLVDFFTALNGETWTNTWDTSSNTIHSEKWYGVTIYDGHIVGLDLSNNNVSGVLPDILNTFPFLTELNLSSNKITGLEAALPPELNISIDRQVNNLGVLNLSLTSVIKDSSINRYDHDQQDFINQTYRLTIGSFSRTLNIPETGIKLIDLMSKWKVPNGQKVIVRQNSGDALNSIINYDLTFKSGDANLDDNLNVLDIQTTINYILGDFTRYFNFYGADVTGDDNVNILDLVAQVNILQFQDRNSDIITNNDETNQDIGNYDSARLGIINEELILDTNGNEVTSFEIILEDATEAMVEELISNLGFNVFVKEIGNQQLSIVAFSLNAALVGEVVLAKISNSGAAVVSALLSDKEANEIPVEIIDDTLGNDDVELPDSLNELQAKPKNFPNPFSEETVIEFVSNNTIAKGMLTVYDVVGRKVEEQKIKSITKGKNNYTFKRRSELPSGTYFYTIKSTSNTSLFLKGKMTTN